ncbi:MAG: riboflavin synthase [Pseudomonadota bacterium]
MFTGIIEAQGQIAVIERVGGDARMTIESASGYVTGANLGDSIAINGVCLTAVAFTAQGFVADLSAETLQGTTASTWRVGQPVNLEKALTPHKPLGGHMVSGHVDGIGHLVEKHEDARGWRLSFEVPKSIAKYIARKGSITIDGISLTVNEVDRSRFGVMVIPHTWQHTTLGTLKVGGPVNLEVDLIARYLERLLAARDE